MMKNVRMFLFSLLMTSISLTVVNAAISGDSALNQNQLRKAILSHLKGSNKLILSEDRTAIVKFIVNHQNEIVVLEVETEYEQIAQFVKSQLNYQKINVDGVKNMITYFVNVTFTDSPERKPKRVIENVNPLYDLSLANFHVIPSTPLQVICICEDQPGLCQHMTAK